ncbi:hypothetical protein RRSWK_02402 [Rhodopirellula sp. SWK7]|nr:hypothetical protein RRSWK_02402 [Rhodopirellula sp. SWK7]
MKGMISIGIEVASGTCPWHARHLSRKQRDASTSPRGTLIRSSSMRLDVFLVLNLLCALRFARQVIVKS